jgi:predicted ATPase
MSPDAAASTPRLDALAPDARALVQDASVLGKSFPLDALVAVSDRPRQEVEAMLRELVRRDVLEQEADRRSPERGQYSFVQSLIREVAYGTLAKADRRRKHLATAHYFESLEDEELAGIVATHYVEAFEATAAGPEADSLAARARDWLSAAADRALSLGSPEQSLAFLEQALSITLSGEERASLLRRAGESLMRAGRLEEGVVRSEEAIAAYRELGQLAPVARIRPASNGRWRRWEVERVHRTARGGEGRAPEGPTPTSTADVDVALARAP